MKWRTKALVATCLAGALLVGMNSDLLAKKKRVKCGKDHSLSIVDLDMSPDPLGRGKTIRAWQVRLKVDGSGECDTAIEIRDSNGDLAGRRVVRVLTPGTNRLELKPAPGYRFRGREHCFEVIADIERTKRRVDAANRFCARQVDGGRWTMKESGGRRARR